MANSRQGSFARHLGKLGCAAKANPGRQTPRAEFANSIRSCSNPGIASEKIEPLFRSATGKTQRLTDRRMEPNDALRMIERRAKAIDPSEALCNHTFRTDGGTPEQAQEIANHTSPIMTRL